MPRDHVAFFSLRAIAKLVRAGADVVVSEAKGGHRWWGVHLEMLLTCCRWYHTLPDPRSLTAGEIRVYYDGLRPELRRATKSSG